MSDLQTAFYIIGIIFMSLLLIIMVITAIAVVVIRKKIEAIHQHVEDKLRVITDITDKGSAVVGALKKGIKKAKR